MSRRNRQHGQAPQAPLRGTPDTTSSAPPAPASEGATQPEQELEASTDGTPDTTAAGATAPGATAEPGDQGGADGPGDSEGSEAEGVVPPPSAPPPPRGRVRCRVVGPGSVKSRGRLYQEGEIAEFDAIDASELPQLAPVDDEV